MGIVFWAQDRVELLIKIFPVLEMNHPSHPVPPAEKWGLKWVEGIFSILGGIRIKSGLADDQLADHLRKEELYYLPHTRFKKGKGLGI